MGFVKSTANTSLFYNFSKVTCTYLFVYDDDIIITIGNETNVNIFINRLNFEFSLKYIRLLHYFLGIEMYELLNGDMLLKKQSIFMSFLLKITWKLASQLVLLCFPPQYYQLLMMFHLNILSFIEAL